MPLDYETAEDIEEDTEYKHWTYTVPTYPQ